MENHQIPHDTCYSIIPLLKSWYNIIEIWNLTFIALNNNIPTVKNDHCFTKWNKVLSLHLFFCCFINFGYKMGIGSKPTLSLKHVLNVQIRQSAVSMWLNGVKVEIACHIFVIIRWLTVYVSRNSKICCCLHAQKFTLTSRLSLYRSIIRRQPVEFSLLLQIMPHATDELR